MDRRTICEAQAAICIEQAGRGDSDQAFWLAEARYWHELAGEHARAVMSFRDDPCPAEAQARDCETQKRDRPNLRRN